MKSLFRLLARSRRGYLVCTVLPVVTLIPAVAAGPQDAEASARVATITLPKTLEGSLTVEQSHPQSNDPSSGFFTTFDAKATFSKLVFGQGKEGSLTLLRGNLSYSGFDVTQSVTNPNCEATYQFSLDRSKPLLGDLSGFDESQGRWQVEIQLGIDTIGTIVNNSGCGSNGPTSQFGEPPRISFAIAATGRFDPSTGTVTVNDTTKSPFLGGTETDQVFGQLHGGLQIYFESEGKRVNVTDETTKVVVGQPISLEARFPDGSKPDLSGNGWTGITNTTAVKNYDFYNSFARTYFLDQKDLTDPDLIFYWVKEPNEAIEGDFQISVTGVNRKTGEEETGETAFDVMAPQVNAFGAITCGAGVNRTVTNPALHLNAPELSLGFNDTAPGCHGVPGVTWGIDVTAPLISGGHFAMTQLVSESETHDGTPCTQGGLSMNGTQTVADGGRSYNHIEDSIGANAQWKPEHPPLNDSPSVGLQNGGTWVKADTFTDYLMFKPDAAGSTWIALAQMGPWNWSGTAAIRSGRWVLTAYQNPARTLSSTQASAQPEWNGQIGLFTPVSGC